MEKNKTTKYYTALCIIVSLCSFQLSKAQYLYDIGIGGGLSGYTGEVSTTPFTSPGYNATAFYRSNINARFAVRIEGTYGELSGSTANVDETYPGADGVCQFDFSTQFVGLNILGEVNFFPYPYQKHVRNSKNITPFAFAGLGVEKYTPTSGEVSETGDGGNSFSIPFGIGGRWAFADKWGLHFHFKATKLFEDNFEGIQLEDPYELGTSSFHKNDWYYTTTLMVTYSFGENIWDCNCPGGYKRKK